MTNISELIAQKEAIEQQIKELRKNQCQDAILRIRELVSEFDLSAADIFAKGSKAGTSSKVAPKYRDPVSGKTWTGRGRTPRWMDGKSPDEFLIK
jgi:DNA-binding protein H-NS